MDESISTGAAASAAPSSTPTTTTTAPSTPASTPTTSATSSPSTTTSTETSSASSAVSSGSGTSLASATDSQGTRFELVQENGRRVLKAVKATEQPQQQSLPPSTNQMPAADAGEPYQTSQAAPEQQAQEPKLTSDIDALMEREKAQPAMYNLNEFSNALANGNVDERRVPQEFQQQYIQFRTDQAIKEFNQRMQAQEQQRQQIQRQLSPEEKASNMQAFYKELDQEASNRARVDAQLTDDDMQDLEYMDDNDPKKVNYQMAKEWHKQQLMNNLQQRAAQEAAAKEATRKVYEGVINFVNNAKATEPHFNEIDVLMNNRYKELPYAEGVKYQAAIEALGNNTLTQPQSELLLEYYNKCRREYYAQRNGLNVAPKAVQRPPTVEQAGSGAELSKPAYSPDFSQLRGKTGRERRAWLAEYLRNNGR